MAISDPFRPAHAIRVRVYYEDTDLAGIVYHANYLRFLERARTDWLRDLGIDQTAMADGPSGLFFAVRHMDIDFRAPARFDDLLAVESMPVLARGARAVVDQRIRRDGAVLCAARVTVACITRSGRPARMPARLAAAFGAGGPGTPSTLG